MDCNYVQAAAEYVRARIGETPRIGLILGSGLGGIAEVIEDKHVIPYGEIPHFVCSTAPGHKGQFVAGRFGGKPVICMQGRLHFYEGHALSDIIFPVRVMKQLGVTSLIVTNAAGGINTSFQVGDLMLIEDHINFMGTNPLIGPNDASFGPRFCDMTYTYTPALRQAAQEAAQSLGLTLQKRPRKSGPSGPWAPTLWACPPSRKSLPPRTADCRYWHSLSLPTWPPAFWTSP